MLLNNLYKILLLEKDSNGYMVKAQIELNPGHPIFDGHFPGNPVLPGVCTVQIIREILEQVMDKPLWMTGATNIKYLGFIVPTNQPRVEYVLQLKHTDEGVLTCSASVLSNGTAVCSFKGEFRAEVGGNR